MTTVQCIAEPRRARRMGAGAIARALRCTVPALALLAPCGTSAGTIDAAVGAPRISFAVPGAALVRNVSLAYDPGQIALEVVTRACAAEPVVDGPGMGRAEPCGGARAAALRSHDASATLRLPVVAPGLPKVDFSVHAWNEAGDLDSAAGHGTAGTVELTFLRGRYELFAGHTRPLVGEAARSSWAGAGMELGNGMHARLTFDAAGDLVAGSRERRYTLQAAQGLAGWRVTSSIAYAPDDLVRRWRAGLGIERRF